MTLKTKQSNLVLEDYGKLYVFLKTSCVYFSTNNNLQPINDTKVYPCIVWFSVGVISLLNVFIRMIIRILENNYQQSRNIAII